MTEAARSAYLGQFTDETADRIAGALQEAGIVWAFKRSGRLGQFLFAGDWGVRLFVDSARLEDARKIARGLVPDA